MSEPIKVTVTKQYVIDGQVVLDEHAHRLLSLPDVSVKFEGVYAPEVVTNCTMKDVADAYQSLCPQSDAELADVISEVRAADGQPVCTCTPNDVCYSCYSRRREQVADTPSPTDQQVRDFIRRNPEWFEQWVAKQNRIHGGPKWR